MYENNMVKLFYDFMSQPSRALYIFFKINKIPFEPCQVNLRKGEHFNKEFKQLSRFQKVPFIHDNHFKLAESIAIVRYIVAKYNINNNWYPQNLEQRAKIDEYLEWQHNNLRLVLSLYFWKVFLIPNITGKCPDPEKKEAEKLKVFDMVDKLENLFLGQNQYLCGDQISVADLFAACEIEQPRMAGLDPTENRPNIRSWLDRVKSDCSPYYQEASAVLEKVALATISKNTKKGIIKNKL